MTNSATRPRPPRDLQAEGRRLWRKVLDDLELDPHEMALLRGACRTVDRLEAIAVELETAPLTTTNYKGDEVPHPLLVEQRQQLQSLGRTLANLRMPTGLTDDGDLVRPRRRGGNRAPYLKGVN